jgi:hypothetical protein
MPLSEPPMNCPECSHPMLLSQTQCEPQPVEFYWLCENMQCDYIGHKLETPQFDAGVDR